MSRLPDLAYHFVTGPQWRAGLRDDLEVVGAEVRPPDPLVARRVPGTGPTDDGALVTTDGCGRPLWVRPDRSVLRWDALGVVDLGPLGSGPVPRDVACSGGQLWLATSEAIERYDAHDRQRLGTTAALDDARPVALAADGDRGTWVLARRACGTLLLARLDCWGAWVGEPRSLPVAGDDSARVAAAASSPVVVLPNHRARSLVVVRDDPSSIHLVGLGAGPDPVGVAADEGDRIVVLRVDGADRRVVLEVVTVDGEVDERHVVDLPRGIAPARTVAAGDRGIVIGGAGGLAVLERTSTSTARRTSVFVTPTLRSPLGQRDPAGGRGQVGGWNRAEVDVTLPRGTVVEVAWAATGDAQVAAEVDVLLGDDGMAPGDRLAALATRLTWRPGDRVVYESAADASQPQGAPERLAAPIDVPDEFLWVRVTLTTGVGAAAPTIAGLHVRYPAQAYLDDLPAVYREDESAAVELRRLLAPFEVLFDGIDERIDHLPDRFDPATADDAWSALLLQLLGLPPLDDLAPDRRRTLLRELPGLQQARGTAAALVRALEIVTGRPVTIRDHGAEPGAWFLPRTGRRSGTRLGVDTVVAGARPQPFRVGAVAIGTAPLGVACTDPALVLAEDAALVEIRVELDAGEQEALRLIVERILRVFVPAHCRVVLDIGRGAGSARAGALGVDLRLADAGSGGALLDDGHWQLGATTEIGTWILPAPPTSLAALDGSALRRGSTHLA